MNLDKATAPITGALRGLAFARAALALGARRVGAGTRPIRAATSFLERNMPCVSW